LHSSSVIVRIIKYMRMRGAGHVASKGRLDMERRIVILKPDTSLWTPRGRREDNIKIHVEETGFEEVN
jgi:hypothetical protein